MFMKARKSLLAALLLVLFLSVYVNANAETIPDPPHYGIWILHNNQYTEIPEVPPKRVGAFAGMPRDTVPTAPSVEDTDELVYFFPEAPTGAFANATQWTPIGGSPRAGGTYEVSLFVPIKPGLKINFSPVKTAEGFTAYKVLVDIKTIISELYLIHNGPLLNGYISNASVYPFRRKFPEVKWGN